MATSRKPEKLVLFACGAVVLALLCNLAIQYFAVPSCMRYVLPDSTAYFVTSPLNALWDGASPHLEGYFERAGKEGESPARTFAQSLKKDLEKKNIILRNADHISGLGIDPKSNAAIAIVERQGSQHVVIILPVQDRDLFMKTLERWVAKPVVKQPLTHVNRGIQYAVYSAGDMVLGFGDDGAALLSDNVETLHKVFDTQRENLAYFRSRDRQSLGFLPLWSGKGYSAAWLSGSVRRTAIDVPLLTDLKFTVAIDPQAVRLDASSALPDGRSELISRLLAPPTPATAVPNAAVLQRSEAAAAIADTSLPYFLRYFTSATAAISFSSFNKLFPGLLDELRNLTTLTQISLATSAPSERVPGMIVGLRMSQREAEDLVFRLQSTLRLKRDREILKQAAIRYGEKNGTDVRPFVNVETLLASGLLTSARSALWSRYQFKEGQAALQTPLDKQDFNDESYSRTLTNDIVFRFIMPPVTDDDLAYRFERDQINGDDLKRDRYRLCSSYDGNTLWLGNDAEILGPWIERTRQAPLSTDYEDVLLRAKASGGEKLSALVLPRQLNEAGQLYPDSEVNKMTREYLSDVGQYRAVLLVVTTRSRERAINASTTFLRR